MHGVGDPVHIANTMSPRQIVLIFEETYKHVSRSKADLLGLTRAAYHAESIEKLITSLTEFDKEQKSVTPEEFMRFMGEFSRDG